MSEEKEPVASFEELELAWGEAIIAKDWQRVQQLMMEAYLLEGDAECLNRRYARLVLPALRRPDVISDESLCTLLVAVSGDVHDLDEANQRDLLEFCRAAYPSMRDPAARAWAETHIRESMPIAAAIRLLLELLTSSPESCRNELFFGISLAAQSISPDLGGQVNRVIEDGLGLPIEQLARALADLLLPRRDDQA